MVSLLFILYYTKFPNVFVGTAPHSHTFTIHHIATSSKRSLKLDQSYRLLYFILFEQPAKLIHLITTIESLLYISSPLHCRLPHFSVQCGTSTLFSTALPQNLIINLITTQRFPMQINIPDRGIFRGLGDEQKQRFVNKRYFPNIRNVHQFEYSHGHKNDYKTHIGSFKVYDPSSYKYTRVHKNSNFSQIELGTQRLQHHSEASHQYQSYKNVVPARPIVQKEEGIELGPPETNKEAAQRFKTTTGDFYHPYLKLPEKFVIEFKNLRTERTNPITGEIKSLKPAGYQAFVAGANRKYKANNWTYIPNHNQHFNIITGKKLGPSGKPNEGPLLQNINNR